MSITSSVNSRWRTHYQLSDCELLMACPLPAQWPPDSMPTTSSVASWRCVYHQHCDLWMVCPLPALWPLDDVSVTSSVTTSPSLVKGKSISFFPSLPDSSVLMERAKGLLFRPQKYESSGFGIRPRAALRAWTQPVPALRLKSASATDAQLSQGLNKTLLVSPTKSQAKPHFPIAVSVKLSGIRSTWSTAALSAGSTLGQIKRLFICILCPEYPINTCFLGLWWGIRNAWMRSQIRSTLYNNHDIISSQKNFIVNFIIVILKKIVFYNNHRKTAKIRYYPHPFGWLLSKKKKKPPHQTSVGNSV